MTTTTNNDDGKQRRQQTTVTTNNDNDDVDDKETWWESNTTISISHGERWRRMETAMSNKNERQSKTTTSNDQRRDLGRGEI